MTDTYSKINCPSDCAPGMKCDYCSPRPPVEKPAIRIEEKGTGWQRPQEWDLPAAPEKPASTISFFTTWAAAAWFDPDMLDEAACLKFIINELHPDAARCPDCGLALDNSTSFRAGKRVHCGRCGRWYSSSSGTFLEGSHLDFRQAYLLAVLVGLGVPVQRIAPIIGISADTVRRWIKKFKAFEAHG